MKYGKDTYAEFITVLRIRLQFTIEGTASVAADETAVLVLHRILASDFRVHYSPEVGVRGEGCRG